MEKYSILLKKMETKLLSAEEEKKKQAEELLAMKSKFIKLIEDEHMLC